MPSKLEILQHAQYQDFAFPFIEETVTIGRSWVIHEYTNQDFDGIEGTGLKPNRYVLTISLSGEDFVSQRKKLIALLQDDSPGQLVHPLSGSHSASEPIAPNHCHSSDGGMGYISPHVADAYSISGDRYGGGCT